MQHYHSQDASIKPTKIVIHYPFLLAPIEEPFSAVALSEYLAWGWQKALTSAGDAVHLLHPQAPYRRA